MATAYDIWKRKYLAYDDMSQEEYDRLVDADEEAADMAISDAYWGA